MPYGTIAADRITGTNGDSISPESSVFRNRIINGAMTIDQRNAGASVTPTDGQLTLDRFKIFASQSSKLTVQQNAGSVTPPAGFKNYLGVTSTAATTSGAADYFFINQVIEGFNFFDFDWGTSNAKAAAVSFWVRSSLTGTFGGSLENSGGTRSYPFSYTISAANTWEYKTITIPGDTTGTWVGATNGVGLLFNINLGVGSNRQSTANAWASGDFQAQTGATSVVGTNGATFYITGVQLEAGSTATSFEYRNYQQELALCQRYYYKIKSTGIGVDYALGFAVSSTVYRDITAFPVSMRTVPSSLEQTGTASDYSIRAPASTVTCSAVPFYYSGTVNAAIIEYTVSSGLTTGQGSSSRFPNTNSYVAWSAEL
jgi:hypothetical protein